jgi:multicomponent Na+:H+ antiporter subunit B
LKWFGIPVLVLFLGIMLFATGSLPDRGDPDAPAARRVVPYYIENSLEETDTPNVVTSVLADYRGYDTLGETLVIFTAGLAVILILRRHGRGHKHGGEYWKRGKP